MNNHLPTYMIRALVSFLLAYPMSGFTRVVLAFVLNPQAIIDNPVGSVLALIVGSAWFVILTPLYGGFPISDEGGINHSNMYPYIIPTAIVIFLVLSKVWRLFFFFRRRFCAGPHETTSRDIHP